MTVKMTIDQVGRILLPEDLRRQLGIRPGDEVVLEERSGDWVMRSARDVGGLCWEGNVLVHKGENTTAATTEDVLNEVRSKRFEQLTEGFPE